MQNVAQKELSRAKMLGGIGSILTLLLFVPYYVGSVLVIIGWILILIAVKDISAIKPARREDGAAFALPPLPSPQAGASWRIRQRISSGRQSIRRSADSISPA